MHGAFSGRPSKRKNTDNLREAKTVFHVDQLNAAQKRGAICIVKHRDFNPSLSLSSLLLRHRENQEYITVPKREFYLRSGLVNYDEAEWELIQEVKGYARPSPSDNNWGAYILPADAKVSERFFVEKLIEDLVANHFWYSVTAAETAIATWDGKSFVIDHSSYSFQLVG